MLIAKLLLRISIAGLLLFALLAAAAWFSFPWYAQSLIDRALEGKPFRVMVSGIGYPTLSGISFKSIRAVFTTPPDDCNEAATTYTLSLTNGELLYSVIMPDRQLQSSLLPEKAELSVSLKSDSLSLVPDPRQFTFADQSVHITVTSELLRTGDGSYSIKPLAATFPVRDAVVTREKLRLEGIRYNVKLQAADRWQQPLDTLHIARFSSEGEVMPTGNFRALFGSKRDPLNPCTLTLNDCSIEILQWRASTEKIDYNLKAKQTRFTLDLPEVPLNALPIFNRKSDKTLFANGLAKGSIPIEFQDSTITIRNAMVVATKGSSLTFCNVEGKPLLSLDIGTMKDNSELLKNLNATITLNSKNKKVSALALQNLSATLFEGKISSTPLTLGTTTRNALLTLNLNNIKLLDRLHPLGNFSGTLNGGVSGTFPISMTNKTLAIQNGKMHSTGGGNITIKPSAGSGKGETSYAFSEPQLLFSRLPEGKTSIDFRLKQLQQKSASGEIALVNPKGSLLLWHNPLNRNLVNLSNFSMGLFDGTISIRNLDYDTVTKEGETIVEIRNIALQKLLDLQGTTKIFATGAVKGNIPLKIRNETVEVVNGRLESEQSGQIIYATSDEERAASNPALRITYEALSNLLYARLLSTINMTSDGNSLMSIQLKGTNPDFQRGRPVELNLSIQQNLADLMRTLSISSTVEQTISDKAAKKKR